MTLALIAVVLDSQSNQSFERTFDRFPVRIGRNQLAELQIDRPYVSQFHLALEVVNGRIWVKDLGSTNGTIYGGAKLMREQAIDVTGAPEIKIGPVLVRLRIQDVEQAPMAPSTRQASVLDLGTPAGARLLEQRRQPLSPGPEDAFVRQLVPYIEAYRSSWANVYRLMYEHLPRLQPDVRNRYIQRILTEHPGVAQELDFQRVAQYFGVPAHAYGELTAPMAAMAAMHELSSQLAPGAVGLDSPDQILSFARRLRDTMNVFLRCFVSLRDGYQEFEAEVLRKDPLDAQASGVSTAKDHAELGRVLFSEETSSEQNSHQLNEIFIEVMTHQVAMLNGVMEGVKQLLGALSPSAVEQRYEKRGKKAGIFSNKYEGLWQEYQTAHSDYQGEDKETFLIIFGPQFSRAYAATTGEAYTASGEPTGTQAGRLPGAQLHRR